MGGCLAGWMGGWMGGRADEWMDGWMEMDAQQVPVQDLIVDMSYVNKHLACSDWIQLKTLKQSYKSSLLRSYLCCRKLNV